MYVEFTLCVALGAYHAGSQHLNPPFSLQHARTIYNDSPCQQATAAGLHDVGAAETELFFCHICEKELSRMEEAMRAQHINRCCDSLEQQVW